MPVSYGQAEYGLDEKEALSVWPYDNHAKKMMLALRSPAFALAVHVLLK